MQKRGKGGLLKTKVSNIYLISFSHGWFADGCRYILDDDLAPQGVEVDDMLAVHAPTSVITVVELYNVLHDIEM